ncbi:MAG: hydantoinase B/oxoprolinase family protein, partial [bacterium]
MDPVLLEVYKHRYAGIAEEMGAVLQRTASSPNIKERRDYSCALFDVRGRTVAQGDHMPVHLGSMPRSVAAALELGPLRPGELVLLSDPFAGGTHLPDLTMVAPVFAPLPRGRGAAAEDRAAEPLFYAASRAHHADVGGGAPGSMSVAREIFQEGLRIPPVRFRRAGEADPDPGLMDLLLANVRTPEEREGDLRAQVAALDVGSRRLEEILTERGLEEPLAYAGHLMDYAERMTRALIADLPDGTYRFEDVLDDDGMGSGPAAIRTAVTIEGDGAVVDFTGSAPQVEGPLNAVEAITLSAAVYVFRCLLDPAVPPNHGSFVPLEVIAPLGSVVNARPPAAVAAGNVETSQRITDVLFGALARAVPDRVPAASQGTMNNLSIGGTDPRTGRPFTYYETTGGGMGGRPHGPGPSAIHVHMTNTRNTPVEALEHAYPFRVERYAIRTGSGGSGLHPGGDGIIRQIRLLAPSTVSLLTERRERGPWGLRGGGEGTPGRNVRIGRDGSEQPLPGKGSWRFEAGEALRLETPDAASPLLSPSPPAGRL